MTEENNNNINDNETSEEVEYYEVEFYEDNSTQSQSTNKNSNMSIKEKWKMTIKNINYMLSYTPALGFVAVFSVLTFLGALFFDSQRRLCIEKDSLRNSLLFIEVFFAISCILFVGVLIYSIVLNVRRRKQGKK